MPMSRPEFEAQKAGFSDLTRRLADAGFDRFGSPAFILDQAGLMDGPVLDVCTGSGIAARAAAGRDFQVVGIDASAPDLEFAAALTVDAGLASRVTFTAADAEILPFGDGHFGSAVAIDALHHLRAGAPALCEMMRVVKPGGLLVIADFSAEGFAMLKRVFATKGETHDEGPVTLDWARGFLTARGATEVRTASGHWHHVAVFRTPAARRWPTSSPARRRSRDEPEPGPS